MYLLRKPILVVSNSSAVKNLMVKLPLTRSVVERFVAGEHTADATAAVARLRDAGLRVTLDHLGEYTTSPEQAQHTVDAYLDLIAALVTDNNAGGSEVSVKLSAVGQSLGGNGSGITAAAQATALANARKIADAAYAAGARMTLDMEDHTTIDSTLEILTELRRDHPDVGVAIQAMLHRTPKDLEQLVGAGSRVRLVKGAYDEPETVAYRDPQQVDLAYVRGLRQLMAGDGYPMIGSHDPRMIAIGEKLAAEHGRAADGYEHQFLYGIRPDEQRRLAAAGKTVRVYIPYGTDWYGYFTRRLAERPANLMFFLRATMSKS